MTHYEAGLGIKTTEEDNYEEGCLPETAQAYEFNIEFEGFSVKELLERMKDYFMCEDEDIQLNACDEKGRIDIQLLENAEGYKMNSSEKELWKEGKIKAYLSNYSFHIEKVTREEITL